MYLEGIIVCVNYSDFLAHTLPHNKHHFDNLIVVTDTKDILTKEVCEFYHVRCLQTDIFYENGDSFNKGAAINYGLEHLSKKGWVVHMDSDIYLPPLTRTILDNIPLQEDKIYGIDRLMCPSYEDWIKFINTPQRIHEGWIYIHMNSFPIGVRIAEYMNKNAGWEPIGYFQLWHPEGSGISNYPTEHDYCDRTDVLHAKKFPREKRELLPEIIAVHLDSEGLSVNEMGKNWKGRKTKRFGETLQSKDDIHLELEPIVEELKEIAKKYNLPHIDVKITNRSMCLWKRIFTSGLTVFNSRKRKFNILNICKFRKRKRYRCKNK